MDMVSPAQVSISSSVEWFIFSEAIVNFVLRISHSIPILLYQTVYHSDEILRNFDLVLINELYLEEILRM